jgi:hypothetical protein
MKPGLVVLYRWRLRPASEDSFVRAWSRVTALLLTRGSLGSRLHKGSDDLWYGYAQWPDDETRLAAFATPNDPEASQQMRDAILERLPEISLACVADYLVPPVQPSPAEATPL